MSHRVHCETYSSFGVLGLRLVSAANPKDVEMPSWRVFAREGSAPRVAFVRSPTDLNRAPSDRAFYYKSATRLGLSPSVT